MTRRWLAVLLGGHALALWTVAPYLASMPLDASPWWFLGVYPWLAAHPVRSLALLPFVLAVLPLLRPLAAGRAPAT